MSVISLTISRFLVITLSFMVGLALMFSHLPLGLSWLGSIWVVLILLYWVLMMPQYVNLGIAWLVGFLLDVIYDVAIGEHAFAMVLVAFLVIKFREKILPLGFIKTAVIIFGLMIIYKTSLFLMQLYSGGYFNVWSILGGAVAGALIWPPLGLLLFNSQRKLRI